MSPNDDNFVTVTVTSVDGRFELAAIVSEEWDYEDLVLTVRLEGKDSITYDNDLWLMDHLMPAAEAACEGIGEYQQDEQYVVKELGIAVTDICHIHQLFLTAKDYGIIVEDYLDEIGFSAN